MSCQALLRIRRFDASYAEPVRLPDGTALLLRPLGPGDAARISDLFERLSPHSRQLRFLYSKTTLSEGELHTLSDVDGEQRFAIAACQPERGGRMVGVARFVVTGEGPREAEVAVAVTDELQGRGLGRCLLRRLIEAARERDLGSLHFDVSEENAAMIGLLHAELPGARFGLAHQGVRSIDSELGEARRGGSLDRPELTSAGKAP